MVLHVVEGKKEAAGAVQTSYGNDVLRSVFFFIFFLGFEESWPLKVFFGVDITHCAAGIF